MPYLTEQRQKHFEAILCQLAMTPLENPGDLNFLFTKIGLKYIHDKGESYQIHNDIHGALHCASEEFYLRKTLPYEEKKCDLNGDVYDE